MGQSEAGETAAIIGGFHALKGGANMLPRIKELNPLSGFRLYVLFDSGERRIYNVKEDIETLDEFHDLETIPGLFEQVKTDSSRTCVYWTDKIDLASDTLLEYGESAS